MVSVQVQAFFLALWLFCFVSFYFIFSACEKGVFGAALKWSKIFFKNIFVFRFVLPENLAKFADNIIFSE